MTLTAYDELAYPSRPFPQTHPLWLAVPAALFGLDYAPAERARVLEIGCGEGGNLIPMAVSYPDGHFVGFDLAPTAIAAGREVIEALGLTNIRLETLDILEAGADLGEFDYIIAHGVYSWVPEPVREGVLRVIRECLAPDGLAFVSYNALPGCHLRMALREMILRHLRGVEGHAARLEATRRFLEFYIANAPDNDPTAATLKTYCRAMLQRDPRVLFHDELGSFFSPFYFHEFVADAERHGLVFMAESDGPSWREELFPSSRGKAIAATAGQDPLDTQQYLDYLTARLFRQTIIGRADRPFIRAVDHRRVRNLWVRAQVRTETPDPDLTSDASVRFEFSEAGISLNQPTLKAALHRIGQAWPAPVAVAALPDDADVHEALLQLFSAGYLELTVAAPPFTIAAGQYPVASRLARLQLSRGQSVLCGLDHSTVRFEDETSRRFLALLDGSRDRDALAAEMREAEIAPADMVALVDQHLAGLARLGLLAA